MAKELLWWERGNQLIVEEAATETRPSNGRRKECAHDRPMADSLPV